MKILINYHIQNSNKKQVIKEIMIKNMKNAKPSTYLNKNICKK